MPTTGTISTDDAQEHAWNAVATQTVSEHRWYTKQLIVARDDAGDLFGFYYLNPASELQEDQDRFESDPVPVFAVVAREVTTTVYDVVKDGDDA